MKLAKRAVFTCTLFWVRSGVALNSHRSHLRCTLGQGAWFTLNSPGRSSAAVCQKCRLRKLAVPLQIQKVSGANDWSRASRRELQKHIGPSVNPMAFRSAHSCQTYVVQVFTITVQTETAHNCLDTARVICTLNTCCKDYSLAEPGKALTHRVPQSCISRMLAETRELQNQRNCRGRAAAKLLG